MCFHCAVSLHILTFYLTMTQNHRKHPSFGEGREQKGTEIFTTVAAWMKFLHVRKELHMMLNYICKTASYYFSGGFIGMFIQWIATGQEGNLEKPLVSFISITCRFYCNCLSRKSFSEKIPKFNSHGLS